MVDPPTPPKKIITYQQEKNTNNKIAATFWAKNTNKNHCSPQVKSHFDNSQIKYQANRNISNWKTTRPTVQVFKDPAWEQYQQPRNHPAESWLGKKRRKVCRPVRDTSGGVVMRPYAQCPKALKTISFKSKAINILTNPKAKTYSNKVIIWFYSVIIAFVISVIEGKFCLTCFSFSPQDTLKMGERRKVKSSQNTSLLLDQCVWTMRMSFLQWASSSANYYPIASCPTSLIISDISYC